MKLRMLTMNIHKGFSNFNLAFTLHQLKAALQSTNADILFLQEVVGENLHLQKKIASWPSQSQSEFLADSKWTYQVYGKNMVRHHRHHGNAILSRYEILLHENIPISTYRLEQRGLQHCSISIPNLSKPLHLLNVHLDLTHFSRKKQISQIIHRISDRVPQDSPLILAGDFNDWGQKLSPSLKNFLNLEESFHAIHGYHAKSFPSFFPFLRLDRVYFRYLNVVYSKVLNQKTWSILSDHLPILSEFDIE